jgi:hypothetical protein
MTDPWLGAGNDLGKYALVLLVYAALFVIMRYAHASVEPEFRKTYWVLFWGWGIATFIANYAIYRLGFMSFLPWLNDFFHTFVWIGLCLGFLYAGAWRRPWLEQFLLFAIFSFIVKVAERLILGTWEHGSFFFIPGNVAYLIGWSLMDGLYPTLSKVALKILRKFIPGLVQP